MKHKTVPIYGNKEEGRLGYTIWYDMEEKKVYKSYQKNINQVWYWVFFFSGLFLMRFFQGTTVPVQNFFIEAIFIIIGVSISLYIGRIVHKRSSYDYKEIFMSDEELKEYMKQGKKRFGFEIILVIVIFLISVISLIFFIIYKLIRLLLLLFVLTFVLGILGSNSLIDRVTLYKNVIV